MIQIISQWKNCRSKGGRNVNSYRIGIDVGGTNTDAVLLDQNAKIIHSLKTPTTKDVSTGIYKAIDRLLKETHVDKGKIDYAMLGTTHCTNAIVERKGLNKIAIIRIGAPATLAIKPLAGIPEDLKQVMGEHVYLVEGGHEFDGNEIVALDQKELYRIAHQLKGKVDSIAITSVFSPVSKEHEIRSEEIMKEVLGEDVHVSLSNEIGSIGLLERENATILNACVINVAKSTAEGFVNALKEENIDAKVFFCQNDGTLMSIEYTMKYPIFTIACGPTNSLRGASYLGERQNAITVDVGGTTTDVGILFKGFPRESSLAVEIGGVRTNFRMPDITSVGLGGGTIIHLDQDNGEYKIGPESVGYEISHRALVFGGDVLTATDVAVAVGVADVGDKALVQHLDKNLMKKIYNSYVEMVEVEIDKIKTSAEPVPVILVGGGSVLLPGQLKGAAQVIKHENGGVANAIGAAIAQASGQIEKVFSLDELGREQTLELAKKLAVEEAIQAGANPDAIEIVHIEDVPLAYIPGNATKISVKAAGSLI